LRFSQITVYVHLIMSELNNGESLSQQDNRLAASNPEAAQGFTAERVLRTRPRTYRAIVRQLAEGVPVSQIARLDRVSTHTVRAIRAREAQDIAERKKRLALLCADVSERGFERVEQLVGKGNLRDAAMCAGIAADKLVALTQSGPMVALQVNIEDIERRRAEARARRAELDAMIAE
jgi:hypothetical protein